MNTNTHARSRERHVGPNKNLRRCQDKISARTQNTEGGLTDVAPDRDDDVGVVAPNNGVDAVDHVSGKQPCNHRKSGDVPGAPVPWERNENEESCQQRNIRKFGMYHDTAE